jgi:hypothetical protein
MRMDMFFCSKVPYHDVVTSINPRTTQIESDRFAGDEWVGTT